MQFSLRKKELYLSASLKILQVMKFTAIFLLTTCIHVSAAVYSQKIELSVKNVSLTTVFKSVEKQTGYKFFYDNKLLNNSKSVSAHFTNGTIHQVLQKVLQNQSLSYEILDKTIVIRKKEDHNTRPSDRQTSSQNLSPLSNRISRDEQTVPKTSGDKTITLISADIKVRGNVKDEKGEALTGVTIMVKGTARGAVTDGSGNFSIDVPNAEATLTFSFVGYLTQEVVVGNRTSVDVVMQPDEAILEEVVVVGYGTEKKRNVTGSIVAISNEDIKSSPATTVSNTLAGRLPGLIASNSSGEPGFDDASILIRGISTTGNAAPLIVIDGVPDRAGGFSRLDPNDIETFTVLKDASAAIYGSRAANGVILITTKRGKKGAPVASYNFNYGLRQPTRIPKMLNSADYATAINELNMSAGQSPSYTDEDIRKFRDGSSPLTHPNTNWFEETLAPVTGQTQQNISVSGGSEKVDYYVSIGHQFQDGYYRNGVTKYNQYNLRSNLDANITDNLKIFLNLAARREDRNNPHHGSETIYRYILSGKPIQNAYLPGTDLPALAIGDDVNPVAAVTNLAGYQRDERLFYNADIGFTHNMPYLLNGLSLTGGAYFDASNTIYKHLQKGFDLYSKVQGQEPTRVRYGLATGSIDQNMSRSLGITSNLRLNYDKRFGNHDLGAFVAYEQHTFSSDYLSAYRNNLLSTEIDQIFAGEINSAMRTDGNAGKFARQNYFGRLNYGFDDRYFLTFNWRYDGSSIFPKENRYGFFPGVSAGWRVSGEPFFESVDFVDDLKLRASWGQLGNDAVGAFQFMNRYIITNTQGGVFGAADPTLAPGLITSVMANPNITWETATTYNAGFDADLFSRKLSLSAEVFYTSRRNILGPRSSSIPDYLGLTLPDENLREVDNKGIEISFSYRPKIRKGQLTVGGNFAYNHNKIVYMDEAAGAFPWQMATGQPVGARLLWEAIGIFKSDEQIQNTPHAPGTKPGDLIFRDVDGDGQINGNDRVRQDITGVPRITFGLPINYALGNWNLNMLLQGQAKAKQYLYFQSGTIGNFTQDYFDNRWTPENPDASGPRLYDRESIPSTSYVNDYFFRDASFVRLKSVQLSYKFGKEVLQKLPFSSLSVFVSGFNLITIDKLKFIDPETIANDQNYIGWNTPQTRIFNFGLNVSF